MTRTAPDFASLLADARAELLALVPQADNPAIARPLTAMATIIAMARCHLTAFARDNQVTVILCCEPLPAACLPAQDLLAHATAAIDRSLGEAKTALAMALDQWIHKRGFLALVISLVRQGVAHDTIEQLADTIAHHTGLLHERLCAIGIEHRKAICARDLGPSLPVNGHVLGDTLHWLLLPGLGGDHRRAEIIRRRKQALTAYGAIASVLREPAITACIDEGQPIKARLQQRLGLSTAQLRALRDARSLSETIEEVHDLVQAVRKLILYEVPLHQWPTGQAWKDEIWRWYEPLAILRPDYLAGNTERRDAVQALVTDILSPLAAERLRMLGIPNCHNLQSFVQSVNMPLVYAYGDDHRLWLRAIRQAIIGPRGVTAFGEACQLWHRRAASVAAMRHEQQADQPGWPGLCPPWTSRDGRYSVTVLTSAGDLVEEGNALEHCVGGYYGQCRSGGTQILSLRGSDGQRATLELLVDEPQKSRLSIRLGQFKSRRNRKPDRECYEVLHGFLDDLSSGRHPLNRQQILTYRREMADKGDYARSYGMIPSLDHARRVWPLYRPLLPKGTPADFDAWCEASGLVDAIDAALNAIVGTRQPAWALAA